jgi:hypothetical protein
MRDGEIDARRPAARGAVLVAGDRERRVAIERKSASSVCAVVA